MEYWRIMREAWSVTVHSRTLWWLGAIMSAQIAVYTMVILCLTIPLAMLPQLASTLASPDLAEVFDASGQDPLLDATQWLGSHIGAIAIGVALVLAVWVVLGVFDVAAQVGLVTQVNRVAEGQRATASAGLRDGRRMWWRVVALLAIVALPGLVYLLAMALVGLFTVTLPLFQGELPSPTVAAVANSALSPLSGLVSLITIPLAVLVQLAMRYAVIEDTAWRASFGSAWRLLKSEFAEIAIAYVLLVSVGMVASFALMTISAIVVTLVAVLILGGALLATGGNVLMAGPAALVSAGVLGAISFFAYSVVFYVWQSSMWTLIWRDRTGRQTDVAARQVVQMAVGSVAGSLAEGSL